MKVALVNVTSGGMSGGYHKYLRSLLPLLRQDDRIARLDLFMPPGLEPPDGGPFEPWPASGGMRRHEPLRSHLERLAPDVVFFPTARMLRTTGIPTVVMVRNMEPLAVPFGGNTWRESLRNLARAHVARAACRGASRVIAVSRHVQEFVVGQWSIPPERVGIVYHGIDPASALAPARPSVLAGLGRFVFTAGSIRPARGLEDLISAAPAVIRAEPALKIVVAGGTDPSGRAYERRLRRLSERLGVAEAILWAGQLSPGEMAWAYAGCTAFVVTSRAEACPNVALEAMSHGARIVSTSQPPMPEFFGDVAGYYPPKDAAQLAARLVATVAASGGGEARARAAVARAGTFTWRRTADRTIEELQRAAEATR